MKRDKLNQAKDLILEYIDESEYFPEFFKAEAKQLAVNMFSPIREMLGNMELLYRRTISKE